MCTTHLACVLCIHIHISICKYTSGSSSNGTQKPANVNWANYHIKSLSPKILFLPFLLAIYVFQLKGCIAIWMVRHQNKPVQYINSPIQFVMPSQCKCAVCIVHSSLHCITVLLLTYIIHCILAHLSVINLHHTYSMYEVICMYYVYLVVLNCTRTVKDTSLMRTLSDVPTTQSCVQIYVSLN